MTEREIAALHHENTGTPFKRLGYIKDRFMQARIDAALKVDEAKAAVRPNYWGFS